ncbi:origin recognition complex subunit 2 isoform X1 [Schistocerca americana]|uniref:origin recognition complex subunit 2 isoform X1 n=2 Tax=Schistocerca americana TaxID=7009 RepID=UPI001F5015EF|nr:origin recognition complex subunit 2 isoform X1 [Schistocerca americana]
MEKLKKRVIEIRSISDDDVETIIKPLSVVIEDPKGARMTRSRNNKVIPSQIQKTPSRRQSSRISRVAPIVEEDEDEEDTFVDNARIAASVVSDTPKGALLGDDNVKGEQMFGFQTPKRRNALAQKALESVQTPDREGIPKAHGLNGQFQTPKRRSALASVQTPDQEGVTKARGLSGHATPTSSHTRSKTRTPQRRLSVCTPLRKLRTPSRQVQTPSTRLRQLDADTAKTPYNLRKRIGKKIVQMTKDFGSDSDISSSESEYCPSDENEEDIAENEEENTENEEENNTSAGDTDSDDDQRSHESERASRSAARKEKRILPQNSGLLSACNVKESDYKLEPEQYFSTHSNKKHHTSGRLLSSRLSQDVLQKLLSEVPEKHSKCIAKLCKNHLRLFPNWHFALREGFSILLYGVGSKRKLLQSFQETVMDESDVLVVNGFFPSLSINEVVNMIAKNILELSNVPADLYECLELVQSWYSGIYKNSLYLIVHNIDGEMLRNDKCQDVLSRLASTPNIYLLASIDHINAPLVWDQAKLSSFNFTWWDVTNFLPYFTETSFECSVMVKNSGSLALSSLNNVFKALTTNARSIFLLIAQRHIENKDNSNFRGVLFRDLYQACRDALLVSSDLALRSQLTDFLDHHMLRSRRGADGSEYLHIPVESSVLNQFMAQHSCDD